MARRPSRARYAHLDLPASCSSLTARSGAELVFGSTNTLRIDAHHWPPTIVVDDGRSTYDAARGRDGSWLFHVKVGDGYRLARAPSICADYDAVDAAVPIGTPDIRALFPSLQEPHLGIDLAHTHALTDVVVVGKRAVLVPRHVGYGDQR